MAKQPRRLPRQQRVKAHGMPHMGNMDEQLKALQSSVEELTRNKGTVEASAVTVSDLLALGVLSAEQVHALEEGGATAVTPTAAPSKPAAKYPAYYGRTAFEKAASVVPKKYSYEPGNLLRYGAVGDATTDDSGALTDALAGSPHVYVPAGYTFLVDQATVSSTRVIYGGGTLKAGSVTGGEGLLYCTAAGTKVKDITIDMSDTSRTGIHLAGDYCVADRVTVLNILSDDTGTESESGVLVSGNYCRVLQPLFRNLQHGTSTNGSVPRCISVQGGAVGTAVINAYGEDINVGVTVGLAQSTTMLGCIFRKMNDNGYYILSTSRNTFIQGGFLEDTEEAFVLGGTDVTVTDLDILNPRVVTGFQQASGTTRIRRVNWKFNADSTSVPSILRSRPTNDTYTAGFLTEYTPVWEASDRFSYPAELLSVFYPGRQVKLTGSVSGDSEARVASATFNGTSTVVTLDSAVLDGSSETLTYVGYKGTKHLVLEDCSFDARLSENGMLVHNNGEVDWLEIHNCDFRPHYSTYTGVAATYYWYTGSGTVHQMDASQNRLRLFNDTATDLSGKVIRFVYPTVTRTSSWRDNEAILDTVDGVTAFIMNVLQANVWVGANGRLNNNTNYLRERELANPEGHKLIYSVTDPSVSSPQAYFAKGDIAINVGPDVGDVWFWRCVVSGQPGQWESVGAAAGVIQDATGWTDTAAQNAFNDLLNKLRSTGVLKTPSPTLTSSSAGSGAGATVPTVSVT